MILIESRYHFPFSLDSENKSRLSNGIILEYAWYKKFKFNYYVEKVREFIISSYACGSVARS